MPEDETVSFTDIIRGDISNNAGLVDDKVLLKADGMPTYHLAVVVDDYLMKITHAFRGEEWLPSAPVHVLLWKYLGWEAEMPKWGHFPLILKPDGNGKLSKRDGQRLGFPVFAMKWTDPATGEALDGFKETGFLPEAYVNILAMLGWSDGSEQEIFSKDELIEKFSIERIHKGGAKFDYEKAKWFNHKYLQEKTDEELFKLVLPIVSKEHSEIDEELLKKVIPLIKERCSLLTEFWSQSHFFFKTPQDIDIEPIKGKWDDNKANFFKEFVDKLDDISDWDTTSLEELFTTTATELGVKKGQVMMPLRIMLVGGKYGPNVMDIAILIGKEELKTRINYTLQLLA